MKVTVCFGPVRVVVPCGDGDILVKDLVKQATVRYKKASGKAPDTWVSVQAVSSAEGGLLDPDDRLADVADDRETLTATFEEAGSDHPGQHTGGDGASGSSVGTGSPDIFHGTERYGACGRTDIEVTGEQMAGGGLQLQVRRGSEPALNQLPEGLGDRAPATSLPPPCQRKAASKRWSAAPIIMESSEPKSPGNSNGLSPGSLSNDSLDWGDDHESRPNLQPQAQPPREQHLRPPAYGRFSRDGSNRLSMQFLGESATGLRWCDAAERLASLPASLGQGHPGPGPPHRGQSLSLPRDHRRKEPLGQANHVDNAVDGSGESTELVVLRSEAGPLGIHVVPDYDHLGKERGLLVQGIEPGGRVDRDHRLQVYDRIIEINGKNLLNMPFHVVQDIFKDSLRSPELRLRVVKHRSGMANYTKKPPAPVFPRSSSDKENIAMVETEERLVGGQPKVATVASTKKLPSNGNHNGGPGSTGTLVRNSGAALLAANTRRIGRKVAIDLTKGPHGLGFSITTRDNPAGGNCPIYIKNILPKGAAVEDGRLRPGDRLLEVNGVEMTGKTQAEAVTVLRNAPAGSVVHIVVSRQDDAGTTGSSPQSNYTESSPESSEELSNSPSQPANSSNESQDSNKSPSSEKPNVVHITNGYHKNNEKSNEDSLIYPWKHKEILQFDIPVHDTEKAGLGVSVKGKTSANHHVAPYDLGIFVKSVLHGGAASRDGRLRTNDQLLNVNGVSLLNQSNADAMETLRRAMLHTEGPIPGVITLTIARRTGSPSPSAPSTGTKDSLSSPKIIEVSSKHEDTCTPDNSGTSENSDTTVIFLPYKDHNRVIDNSLDRSIDCSLDKSLDCVSMRNPVLDRLTGHTQSARHNESYYRATHDTSTWNTTALLAGGASPNDRPHGHLTSPTVNPSNTEMIMIEESPTYGSHQPPNNRGRRADGEDSRRPSVSSQQSSNFKSGPPQLQHQQSQQSEQSTISEPHGDVTYASQLSLDESAAGFSRDAFGRQSMSEKRHATLDAKNTDTYQRNKKIREEREKQRQGDPDLNSSSEDAAGRKKFELGPSLGMKKSSSLESLQTMVQEIQMQDDSDPAYSYRNAQGAVRVIRGRGCNESFRAAVDRSYEAPFASGDLRDRMETLAEEDGVVPDGLGQGLGPPAFACARGAPRQSSLNAMDAKNKLGKKKPGLLKGIGSMFRFGKHRKPSDLDFEIESEDPLGDMEAARRAAKDEQQRIQEQYRRLVQRHRQMEEQQQQQQQQQETASVNGSDYGHTNHQSSQHLNHHHSHHHHHQSHQQSHQQQQISSSHSHHSQQSHSGVGGSSSEGSPGEIGQSRTQRIHQLRAQHQRRHVERRGQYPLDEREERYEQAIQQKVDQPYQKHKQAPQPCPSPSAYDLYGEMTRPGSRMGITDPNQHFSHYVNYDEIQQHLNRRQQHYHSQRRDNREPHQRPVSNFYEYESVQAMMRANQHRMMDNSNTNSLPRRSPQNGPLPTQGQHNPRPQSGVNRLYPTYSAVNGSLHHGAINSTSSVRQGPFVTHVTIREASHTPGSKV